MGEVYPRADGAEHRVLTLHIELVIAGNALPEWENNPVFENVSEERAGLASISGCAQESQTVRFQSLRGGAGGFCPRIDRGPSVEKSHYFQARFVAKRVCFLEEIDTVEPRPQVRLPWFCDSLQLSCRGSAHDAGYAVRNGMGAGFLFCERCGRGVLFSGGNGL